MPDTRDVSGMMQTRATHGAYRVRVPQQPNPRGEAFGALVREARREAGMTQEELVDRSGVSRSTILRWESGDASRPDPDQVRALCLALGVDPRRAAVALGYLSPEDLDLPGGPTLDPKVAEAVRLLEDPRIPAAEKESIVGYLRYLANRPTGEKRAS